jgi:S-methylmethionine-dependent homocysteine/selenocysteine methylase/SAM-dependent methyltransferase
MVKESPLVRDGAEGLEPRSDSASERIERMIAAQRCVLLDGATGTELAQRAGDSPGLDDQRWGVGALVDAPDAVLAVHRSYVDAGCDVISTNTWGLPTVLRGDGPDLADGTRPVHWMDLARRGLRLAREATADGGRGEECAVAFSLNPDVDSDEGPETVRLLARAFEEGAPDLVLVETLALVRDSTYEIIEGLLEIGVPVWLSFRRCREGVCGVFGQHWGGPEGDAFGRSIRRFEKMGVGALLVNCIPPDHVPGMVSWMRDFTDLPLGVYPNLGYLSNDGWRSDTEIGDQEYAELALGWREEGAQIVGGCCGVGPSQIAAAHAALADTKPGQRHPEEDLDRNGERRDRRRAPAPAWRDARGASLYPLQFPDIVCEPGVFVPTQGSFLVWRYLFREGIGAGRRCLDIGCGSGLLTVQLALNGAAHVHGIDLEQAAATSTMTNAFRNGVSDRVSAAAVDLWPWVPEERYGLIVASLYQTPVDPFEQHVSHRPLDYWGRNLVDHLIRLLPEALADDGVAYVMQLSILSQQRTAELLDQAGLDARVVDYAFFEFGDMFSERMEQIARVEKLSDAYHLRLGDEDVMVAYLLEVTRRQGAGEDAR